LDSQPSHGQAPPQSSATVSSDRNAFLANRAVLVAAAAILVGALFWASWPTITGLVRAWETQPDYSHGYFVVPFAAYLLWARRDQFPGMSVPHHLWPGIVLLGLGVAMRYTAALYYLEPIDGWSILLWVAGVAWLIGGWKWFRWSLPGIIFLLFMVPLPFRVERWLSLPLQRIAAILSGWTLQCLGLPALTEGNTIWLGDHTLEIEQACSGLRIFVGIAALAFAYIVLVRRSWWEKALLALAVIPISLIANAARIVLTGVLQELASQEAAQKFTHDFAGWLMIPFAALLFALTLWYLRWLFPHTQQLDMRTIMRERSTAAREQAAG
jgi:exosortase